MSDWKIFRKELLKDKEFKKAYDKLAPEYAMISSLIKKRLQRGMTQKQLATKIGTKQSAIARLESGKANPSFSFLQKVALALGSELRISF